MKRQVIFTGLGGSGKTTVGRAVAEKLNWSWCDLDQVVEEVSGRKVAEIIRVEGEERFRELETQALKKILADEYQAISLGGGALLKVENRELLSSATMLHLDADDAVLSRRIWADQQRGLSRPLADAADESGVLERMRGIRQSRKALLGELKFKVRTDVAAVEQIAETLVGVLGRADQMASDQTDNEMSLIPTEIGSSVIVGSGVRRQISGLVQAEYPRARKIAWLVDVEVGQRWQGELEKLAGPNAVWVSIPSGEKSKSLFEVERISDELLKAGLTRDDVIVAVGGGVVGDLGGLVASLFMRGIGLMHLPTTLVAQVDSAIGGKTGVNLEGGKNSIGTFYPAKTVVCDVDFLSTLPEREYLSGVAEVLKYGVIADSEFFQFVADNSEALKRRDVSLLKQVVEKSVLTKLKFVSTDLEDRAGLRAQLNFGHTVGHALEKLGGYGALLHGEAVALGMLEAARLSEKSEVTASDVSRQLEAVLLRFELPVKISGQLRNRSRRAEWQAALGADKKGFADEATSEKKIRFVMLRKIGEATLKEVTVGQITDHIFAS